MFCKTLRYFAVMGALVLLGGAVYYGMNSPTSPRIDADKTRSAIRDAIHQYADSPELYIVPIQINIPAVDARGYARFSYYGMTFSVPWKEYPSISTSTPSDSFTCLKFARGTKILEVFASGTSISPLADGALLAFLSGVNNSGTITSEYYLKSNLDFVSSSLNSSPAQLSADNSSADYQFVEATALLPLKDDLIHFLAEDTLPVEQLDVLHFLSTKAVRGFQFLGTAADGTTTYRASHFLVFNSRGKSFNLLTLNTTQAEDDFILATLTAN